MRDRIKQVFVSVTVFLFMIITAIAFSSAGEDVKVPFYYMEGEEGFKFVSLIEGSNYTWDFGDGTVGYGREVEHKYSNDGIYQVNLTVKSGENTILESQMITTTNNGPVANFYYSPEYPYTLQQVFFWDNSTDPDGYIINWTWDFGDGNFSYGPFVNHTYMKAGNYTVQLTVVDNQMRADSVTQILVVRNRLPVPKFYWTRNPDGELEFRANFPFDSSYDEDGYIVNYTWDMGDGNIKYGEVIHHTYSTDGEYTVTLTVKDDDNGTSSFSRKIHSNNEMPEVKFRWEPPEPTDLDNVTFISESTDDGTIERYIWELGDGTFSSNQTVVHRYADNGYYMVRLTLIDDEGAFNYTHKTIFIKNVPPVANFTYSPLYPVPGKKIIFNASSSYDLDGEIVEWRWDFGDGSIADGMTVNHTYLGEGVYTVNLTVKDNDGAESYIHKTILLADIYVDENVFDPANKTWNKIQDALDNASDGYFIYVRPGTYEENVFVNKSVMIQGIGAKVECTSYAFWLDAPNIIITNFSIYGGEEGVIFNSTGCILENTSIKASNKGLIFNGNDNVARNVSSISQNASAVINSHLNLIMNSSLHGKIYGIISYGAGNEITGCHIYGGIYGMSISAPHNLIERNHIEEAIYGIYMMEAGDVINNVISNCSWGIKVDSPSLVTIEENEIRDCATAGIEGMTDFIVRDTDFHNNSISIVSHSFVEIYNASVFGGDTGMKIVNGTVEFSLIQGCTKGVETEGFIYMGNSTVKDCENGLTGKSGAEVYGTIFTGNIKAIYGIECSIEKSIFINNQYGAEGSNLSISNSSFEKNDFALYLFNNTKAYNNSFTNNEMAVIVEGEENKVWNNTMHENNYGIILEGKRNSVLNNSIFNNSYGIRVIFAPNNILRYNSMENNTYNLDLEGNKLEHFYLIMDESNTINGKEVKYLINQSGFTLDEDYGYIALINCSVVVVNNANISNNGEGIMLVFSRHIKILDSILLNNEKGIYSLNGDDVSVENVVVKNNSDGISFKTSSNVSIKNGKIIGNARGLNLFFMERMPAMFDIENLSLEGNIIAVNIENMEDVRLKNLTFFENDKGVRTFNSNVSLSSILMDDAIALHISSSSINLSNFDISASTSIDASDASILASNGIIRNSSTGVAGTSSLYEFDSIHIYGNLEAFNVSDSEIRVKGCNISDNGKSVFNSCLLKIEYAELEDNDAALNILKGEATIFNSTFMDNGWSVFARDATVKALNLTISGSDHGIVINASSCNISGGEFFNNSIAIELNGNENIMENLLMHHNGYAIILHGFNNTVKNNSIWGNFHGVVAYDKNFIFHNNFISNTEDARDYGENIWNLSYPAGGNYWDKYAGEDYLSGRGQNESGSDGIGDIPHKFYGNFDYYPLMDYYENASGMPNVAPEASFYFYPTSPFTFQNIIFIDTSRDENGERDMIKWHWDFGDGNKSDERNPVHYYRKSGIYNVTLRVEDRGGMESTFIMKVKVNNLPPVATFSFQPGSPHSFTIIEFNASGSSDKDGVIVNYTWDMGDGTVKKGMVVSHKYSKPGSYKVTLTTVDNEGSESTYTATIEVTNRAPEANFIISPESPREGEEINFTDLSSDLDGEIVEWRWDFGDGSISHNEDAVHKYTRAGEYTVTLEVRDNMGAKANYTMTIKVGKREMPGFGMIAFVLSIFITAVFYRRLKKFK